MKTIDICFYCLCVLSEDHRSLQFKTREHLLAKSKKTKKDKRQRKVLKDKNIVKACLRCNTFVGTWPVETKLKFKSLLQESGGWTELNKMFPKKDFKKHIEIYLNELYNRIIE